MDLSRVLSHFSAGYLQATVERLREFLIVPKSCHYRLNSGFDGDCLLLVGWLSLQSLLLHCLSFVPVEISFTCFLALVRGCLLRLIPAAAAAFGFGDAEFVGRYIAHSFAVPGLLLAFLGLCRVWSLMCTRECLIFIILIVLYFGREFCLGFGFSLDFCLYFLKSFFCSSNRFAIAKWVARILNFKNCILGHCLLGL